MLFDPRIHSFAQLAKSILGQLEKLRGGLNYPSKELLVLNYHSTPKKFIPNFQEQVQFLLQHFNILSPSHLRQYYAGNYSPDKCSLLFTFDDGLKNNLHAVRVLDENKIKALFFVVPGFIEAANQKEFYLKNIRPVVNTKIDREEEDFAALSWSNLSDLIKNGHAIGAHTLTHTLVAESSSAENSEREITGCGNILEKKLGVNPDSFCSINDTLVSTGKKEKALIEKNYSFHFTTLPGFNALHKNPLFIKRRNVECYWPNGAFYFALGKSDLKRWEKKIALYESL